MYSYSSTIWCGEVLLCHIKKLINNVVWWRRTVNEEQIIMSNAVFDKVFPIIFLLIETYHALDIELLKYLYILLWMMTVPLICIPLLYWTHECHEFARDNPIYVTIFNSLIVFIFLHVERAEVVPFILDGILQSLEALQESALIKAITLTGISIRFEQRMIWTEHILCFFCRALQNDNHECSHEESSIDHFVWLLGSAIVEDAVIGIVFVSEQSGQLS